MVRRVATERRRRRPQRERLRSGMDPQDVGTEPEPCRSKPRRLDLLGHDDGFGGGRQERHGPGPLETRKIGEHLGRGRLGRLVSEQTMHERRVAQERGESVAGMLDRRRPRRMRLDVGARNRSEGIGTDPIGDLAEHLAQAALQPNVVRPIVGPEPLCPAAPAFRHEDSIERGPIRVASRGVPEGALELSEGHAAAPVGAEESARAAVACARSRSRSRRSSEGTFSSHSTMVGTEPIRPTRRA